MGKVLLASLWIVTLYLTVIVAIIAVMLIAEVKMSQERDLHPGWILGRNSDSGWLTKCSAGAAVGRGI